MALKTQSAKVKFVYYRNLLHCHPERREATVKDLFVGYHVAVWDNHELILRCSLREPQNDMTAILSAFQAYWLNNYGKENCQPLEMEMISFGTEDVTAVSFPAPPVLPPVPN